MTTGLDRPSFSLVDHHGTPVTDQTFRGRWMLVFFGFTHCRVVCPRALAKLSGVLGELGAQADDVQPLYITVDPDRDTPAVLAEFLRPHHRHLGLTGSAEAVEHAKEEFRVFARRKDDPEDPDGYSVPHTAITYLVSPEGDYVDHFPDALGEEQIVGRLRAHLSS
ncbi:SCO family protein [Lentzea sp. NPDC059081]|uniref:SCO family protein n=1 Tax=Lentzea sp. NPDC059081 TaxID=3346719 RepID=UPI0036C26B6D